MTPVDYDVEMANPTRSDYPDALSWLDDIGARRRANPRQPEIQAAIDAAFTEEGITLNEVVRRTGIQASHLHRSYDLSRNPNSRSAASSGDGS